jgi:hypothetical protein
MYKWVRRVKEANVMYQGEAGNMVGVGLLLLLLLPMAPLLLAGAGTGVGVSRTQKWEK